MKRRKRYVGDILLRGFKLWGENAGERGNAQYYPLLDRVPSREEEDGFEALPECVLDALPKSLWGLSERYLDFRDQRALVRYCLKHAELHRGYAAMMVTGPRGSFRKFLLEVQKLDEDRERTVEVVEVVTVRRSKRKRGVTVDLAGDGLEHVHVAKTRRRAVWVK